MLQHFLAKKNQSLEHGFTLIELLVVTVIVGVLAAISLPNLLGQIGKARETEASSQLGSIGRSQQAYHFETKEFASNMVSLGQNITVADQYYNFPDPIIASISIVKHQAIANTPHNLSSRNFSVGVYFNSGSYLSIFCRSAAPSSAVLAPDTPTDSCSNNGITIR